MIPHSKPWLDHREETAVNAVLCSGMLVKGAEADKFAAALGAAVGEAALFASGRQALTAALQALKLPLGTGVAVQTYVCDAVTWAITSAGLSPVLCDVGPHWTCTPETAAHAIEKGCGAILLAPPFGFLQSAAPFRKFGLPIVHDLCQASPGSIQSARPEDLGDLLTLSFHPTKYICAAGGGAVIALSPAHRAGLRALQDSLAEIAPFSDVQAALGHAQFRKLPEIRERRGELFEILTSNLSSTSLARLRESIDIPVGDLFRMPIDVAPREAASLFPHFAAEGIIVRHGVDQLAHRRMKLSDTLFPNAARRIQHTISLPFYPALEKSDALRITKAAALIL